MAQVATYKIEGSFRMMKTGLLLSGEIITGKIRFNNIVTFENEGMDFSLKIKGISFSHKFHGEILISKVGLLFHCPAGFDPERFLNMKVAPQVAIVADDTY